MGRKKQLTSEEINKIEFYLGQKLSNREIARRLNRSLNVINNYVRNKENYGKNYKGRTKFATSARERRMILRAASNSTKSPAAIAREIKSTASLSTVTRVIKRASHLKRQKLKKKPTLQNHHILTRLEFAKNHMSWTHQWKTVIFTDEKKFNLDGPDGFNYYFHDLRKEEKIMSRRHSSLHSVMVWGAISYYGAIDIVFLQGKQNSKKYLQLLKDEYNKIDTVMSPHQWIFQQDNAPIHTAFEISEWFEQKKVEVLSWPSCSPDLNIMENVWSWLTRQIYVGGQEFNNKQDLIKAIDKAWKNLDLNFIRSLYDSMPNRIFEIIRNNGKFTHY